MGKRYSVGLGNLFLVLLDDAAMTKFHITPGFYGRYIDDVQLAFTISDKEINFLDTTVHKHTENNQTTLTHQTVHQTNRHSSTPPHQVQSPTAHIQWRPQITIHPLQTNLYHQNRLRYGRSKPAPSTWPPALLKRPREAPQNTIWRTPHKPKTPNSSNQE